MSPEIRPAIGFSPESLQVLEPADLIYTWSNSFISKAINFFTKPSISSHIAGVAEEGTDPTIIESTMPRVREIRLVDAIKGPAVAMAWRPELTTREQDIIVEAWRSRIGEKYPWWDLGLQAIDRKLFGGRFIFRRLSFTKNNVCSGLQLYGYQQAGRGIDKNIDEVSPDDLMDWQILHDHPVVWASSEKALMEFERYWYQTRKESKEVLV